MNNKTLYIFFNNNKKVNYNVNNDLKINLKIVVRVINEKKNRPYHLSI